ncbi:DUF2510 domain-containing protein [Leucobacter tardus]|uniref:DUF2510 domain-containing protein n=1 Tax=Leucobacter tardus TaxID=501483 RepID=A0A939QBT0_9MICO|nr:DUF2510 domain-containing protein [Leucobacter tardus]MBO2988867.1 DUF2510 domain-containing protein [Leucobacter tardus]
MTSGSLPPAGWYPDPGAPGLMRFWDGAQWTAHTAPVVPPAAPAEPAIGTRVASAPRARERGPRIWTLRTFLVLGVCVALLIAAPIVLTQTHQGAHRGQAQQVLDGFLASATTSDDDWREYAGPHLQRVVETGAPIGGDPITAEAIDLSIEYEVGELTFDGPAWRQSAARYDVASAPLTLTYTYTAYGREQHATAEQVIWLTRPFYFDSDRASRSDGGADPSSVGPWRVTSLTLPDAGSDVEESVEAEWFTSDLTQPYDRNIDGNICYDPIRALEELSHSARVDGEIVSNCVPEYAESIGHSESAEEQPLVDAFPVIDALNSNFLPREVTQIDLGFSQQLPPLSQYALQTASGEYVFTFASAELDGDQDQRMTSRLIYISKTEGADE